MFLSRCDSGSRPTADSWRSLLPDLSLRLRGLPGLGGRGCAVTQVRANCDGGEPAREGGRQKRHVGGEPVRSGEGPRRSTVIAYVGLLGLLIVGIVMLVNRPSWQTVAVEAVDASDDSAQVAVTVSHPRCAEEPRLAIVEEGPDLVQLRAEQDMAGDCEDIALRSTLAVTLAQELGIRTLEVNGEVWDA